MLTRRRANAYGIGAGNRIDMLVVTGGAGFIGSNLIATLNRAGRDDIVVVDDLSDGVKFRNLVDLDFGDYFDRLEFLEAMRSGSADRLGIERVYHLGACADTAERDGRYMMEANYAYSRAVLDFCATRRVPLVYASSAAVYGTGRRFSECRECEAPINVYGYSKFQFDAHVRRRAPTLGSQVVGVRYFNVYGPREAHKGRMASVVWHFARQVRESGRIRLFRGTEEFGDGEQRRDFVHVDDAVAATVWFATRADVRGIFNVGTGRASTFNSIAEAVRVWFGRGEIEYIDFPADLAGAYQSCTEADLGALRRAGYTGAFRSIETGVPDYLDWIAHHGERD
jgi:ADP-L-glycero-D-manno-heptose 6-epimerase